MDRVYLRASDRLKLSWGEGGGVEMRKKNLCDVVVSLLPYLSIRGNELIEMREDIVVEPWNGKGKGNERFGTRWSGEVCLSRTWSD